VLAVLGLGLIGGSVLRRLSVAPAGEAGPSAVADEAGHSAPAGETGSSAPAGETGPSAAAAGGPSAAAREAGPSGAVGWDPDAAVRAAAREAGLAVVDELDAFAPDAVLVCAPPGATAPAMLDALARWPDAAVFDAASVKRPIAGALAGADRARVLLSHPLAGREASGFAASDPALFEGAVWAACPLPETPVGLLAELSALTDRLGAALTVLSPAEHDRLVARTSHAPHLIAAALAASAVRGDPLAAVTSGGALRDMTRVAGADPELWREIVRLNGDEVAEALEAFAAALGRPPDWDAAAAAVAALPRPRWSARERAPVRHPLAAGWAPWLEGAAAGRTYTGVRRDGDALTASA
jgi:prephenate dehydrogenase